MYSINDPTVNGSSLSAQGIGAFNAANYPVSISQGMGGGVQGANVTATSTVSPTTQGDSFFRNGDGSFNTNNIGLVFGGINMLGNLWNSYQQHKIAKEQLALARETFQTNLKNNTQTYNTALEDRIRARHFTEGKSASETDAYLNENKL